MFRKNFTTTMFVCVLSIACKPTCAAVVEKITVGTACCDHEIQNGMDFTGRSLREHQIEIQTYGECMPDPISLYDVNFTNASLVRSRWAEAVLPKYCSFRGAKLTDAEMECNELESCDFTGATIEGAWIKAITAEQLCSTASYRDKNLRGFRSHVLLSGVSFAGFDLRDTRLYIDETCDITDADIRGATLLFFPSKYRDKVGSGMYPQISATDFPWRMIQSTKSYQEGTLEGFTFSRRIDWSEVDLSGLNLTNTSFVFDFNSAKDRTSQWKDSMFHDAVITGADCRNLTFEQIQQTWNYKHGHMKGIFVSKEVKAALAAEAEQAAKESAEAKPTTTE